MRLLAGFQWVDVNGDIAERAGELGRRFRRSHPGISSVDLIIAATALELNAELATSNVRHFPMFPGLRPAY
jgi:predicted nucleic acid-binding protein